MEERIKKLEEEVEFLKLSIKKMGIITNLDALFEDYKQKKGVFRPNDLN